MNYRIALQGDNGTWTRVATIMAARNKFGVCLKLFTVEDDETGEQKVSKARINRLITELEKIRDDETGKLGPFLPIFPDGRGSEDQDTEQAA